MLLLRFELGGRDYGIPARLIEEVLPLLPLDPVPRAPEMLCGLVHWRGRPVPVLDMGVLLQDAACAENMLTRIVVIKLSDDRLCGLRVEGIQGTLAIKPEELKDTSLELEHAPWLGRVHGQGSKAVQLVEVDRFADERFAGILRSGQEGAG